MKNRDICLTLIFLCALVYANSLFNQFVSDDIPDIFQNSFIGHPSRYVLLPHNFLNSVCYRIGRDNPAPYHVVSILIHGINVIMVFYFLRIFFSRGACMPGAALFAVHPIHTEAVTWISGRPYAITAFFVLGIFLLYHYATQSRRGRPCTCPNGATAMAVPAGSINLRLYVLSLLAFAYYLYYNYTFFLLFPAMLAIYDLTFSRIKKTWPYLLPFFVIMAMRLYPARTALSGRIVSVAQEMGGDVVRTNPLFNMVYSFFSHLGVMIWPVRLTLYHEPPVITVFWLRIGIVALAALAWVMPFLFKRAKEIFFAVCIFGLFLAPTYSPVTISWLLAERYIYTPSIALSIACAYGYQNFIAHSASMRRIGVSLCAAIIAVYAARTVIRNEDWRDQGRLWRATVAVSGQSPRAHNNMGDAFAREGNWEGALREFKRAIELKPAYADPYHNLANIYEVTGNIDEAVKYYTEAVRINPRLYQSHRGLSGIYLRRGDHDRAGYYAKLAAETTVDETLRNDPVSVAASRNAAKR